MTGGLLAALVLAVGVAGPAQAVVIPGGGSLKPWDLRVKASGVIDVSWKIEKGLQGNCTDWYRESGADTLVLKVPERSGRGRYFYGLLSGEGRTTGRALRNLSANGGSSAELGCPGICPKATGAAAAVFDPIARAADCVDPAPYKAPDTSGCQPSIRGLVSPRYSLLAGKPGAGVIPNIVSVTFTGAPRKPFLPCGDPPLLASAYATVSVRVPLLPKLKKRGMVFGRSKGKAPCKGYPKNDGFAKTTCTVEWDVKTSIFRAG